LVVKVLSIEWRESESESASKAEGKENGEWVYQCASDDLTWKGTRLFVREGDLLKPALWTGKGIRVGFENGLRREGEVVRVRSGVGCVWYDVAFGVGVLGMMKVGVWRRGLLMATMMMMVKTRSRSSVRIKGMALWLKDLCDDVMLEADRAVFTTS
jgi:hypothetical protein